MPGTASQVANGTGNDWRTAAMGYGASTIRQKFTGQERDNESGLDSFQARYYNGPQERFLSVDPGNAGASLGDLRVGTGMRMLGTGR
jgi:RHS repeat-associated protein